MHELESAFDIEFIAALQTEQVTFVPSTVIALSFPQSQNPSSFQTSCGGLQRHS